MRRERPEAWTIPALEWVTVSPRSAVVAFVCRVIALQVRRPISEVLPPAALVSDLGAESLDCVEIQESLEAGLGIAITENEASSCSTVAACLQLALGKLGLDSDQAQAA